MGLFSTLFGKKKIQGRNKNVFYAQQDELMKQASLDAQTNFKYFWRELYWEQRRIVPAHDFAMVKVPFQQKFSREKETLVEHMWVNNISFNGEVITGELVNQPNRLTNVDKGDIVTRKIDEIGDWMISIKGKTYGGFTIQVMRSGMNDQEREHHDTTWGLDFGDYNEVLLVYEQKEKPENLAEHPMSKNMTEKMSEFLKDNPEELTIIDDDGLSLLHKEAIAGNKIGIKILLEQGADKDIKSGSGKTALEYAEAMGWEHLIEVFE
ncbi:Uncharacterized conserved protein YegJ, DUF2314 family [Tenacibaculum sp. MAR_2009_124]|uniref:DUF2314 domain-containing protein n=1 Tax=Tenacibaculum sp. MAR_2009_124 TaxID=1250059 RepID=UPI000898A2A8|nr:DUF2314 domain-containing protein [Tenacibaculum sp. MAR_2009_124]SEC25610.1 Uncharacterized conserved protein YegJ, DUF2314 family [Tenacibaculum sp. MAR_2009_124]